MTKQSDTHVAVLGAGPGGYVAAFMAADLGLNVTLIDLEKNPGGVCLYRGCIPSKALLHASGIIDDAVHAGIVGIIFQPPDIDFGKVMAFKNGVVAKLTGGLGMLTTKRNITYLQGKASFSDVNTIQVHGGDQVTTVSFKNAIIATGSRPATIPSVLAFTSRVMDSTGALSLSKIPATLLVVGGGYIGLEMATVYASLGTTVTVVEMSESLLPGVDADLASVLGKSLKKKLNPILLETKVLKIDETTSACDVTFVGKDGAPFTQSFERVLLSVGRVPNTSNIGLERIGVTVNKNGFIEVDSSRRTNVPHIFAIGDVAGNPMLAHKASHEGRVAAEVIAGKKSIFNRLAIPAVVFTHPEIAYGGLTEKEAKEKNISVEVLKFPWAASGRALTMNETDGLTKLIIDPKTERVLGVGIAGRGAGELISEGILAIEMQATAGDLSECIHPHPTLSETMMESADMFFGHSAHMYRPKKDKKSS